MTNPSNSDLNARTNLRNFFRTVASGFHGAATNPRKRKALVALLLLAALLCAMVYWPRNIPAAFNSIMFAFALVTFLCIVPMCAAAIGYVPGALEMQRNFSRIGFSNHAGESPYLIKRELLEHNVTALTYYCTGLPLKMWVDAQLTIETALNMLIASIHEGKDRRTITLYCVQPGHAFELIRWNDTYVLRHNDNLLIAGCGLTGDVIIDLDKTPHILIGGNTGSGKTVLLRCLLWQAIQQSDIVYIADFKGGVDFGRLWHRFAHIITNEKDLLELLNRLVDELEERKKLFIEADSSNIKDYFSKNQQYLNRIIFSCDEVAELLDKTGADKERKELLSQIEARLSTLARQGRAFGIHLVLATQRPDANILPGQIKNNLNVRICGRADATLSTIIIGDGRAAEQIPSDAQGRFIMDNGTVFQAYYFDDSLI